MIVIQMSGATATDDRDGDLTSKIETTGKVDTKKAGTYKITYTVKDAAGNVATATRTVIVKEDKKPEEKPTNTVDGGNNTITNEVSNNIANNSI